ncbi:MAG: insulinase family protein [Anaerolineales bacterium]|nr:insulinase family protein [Anaerolineales bacterium]
MADLHTITRDDLYEHYRTYYVPNNAVLCMAGDFETKSMLKRVRNCLSLWIIFLCRFWIACLAVPMGYLIKLRVFTAH